MSLLLTIPAGMPSFSLSDVTALRLQTISFFLVAFLLSAWGLKGVWNVLQRDWPALPRLSYPAALGVTTLWGLLFVLVLTMISGTRELLTPGAWEKQGATYRLRSEPTEPKEPQPASDKLVEQRLEHLASLGRELLVFAGTHEGRFPTEEEATSLRNNAWRLRQRPASEYRYFAGATAGDRDQVVAFEPSIYGDDPFVLLASGEVVRMPADELAKRLPSEGDAP